MELFEPITLKNLYKPHSASANEDNGQVTIIGGSDLFHGASLLALKTASKFVDMVFFASPEESLHEVVVNLKSQLSSFIWVPWDEVENYIAKSDVILIGSGMKRWHKEQDQTKYDGKIDIYDEAGTNTKFITEKLLRRFSHKRWVIDAGSLQVIDPILIPKNAVLTPNQKEFRLLFGDSTVEHAAQKYSCIIVLKGEVTIVCSATACVKVSGGNAGLTKGGTGDVQAGLTVALMAQNDPFLASCAASWIVKHAADELYKEVGFNYNADDLARVIPSVLKRITP